MLKKIHAYIAIFSLIPLFSSGQEIITGLQTNQLILNNNDILQTKGVADTLELPFFDDFSGRSNIPVTARWSDNFAFVNNTYSNQQITTGIATLDAIDNTGRLYESASSWGFEADHLTSQPMNLEFTPAANIWISFYYQPGGLGDEPELGDSLTLQFYAPDEETWYSVWKAPGVPAHKFKPVIIRIDNPRFLKRGFQFRFVNWASLSANINDPSMIGNCDHWNIDYVILDRNRNESDTALTDVAFRAPLRSILKTHEAMPWKQFREVYLQEMGAVIPVKYRNNDIIVRNVTRNFLIRDLYTNVVTHSFSAGATNISPFTNVDYNASLIYTFNSANADSALFRITCSLITDEFDPKANDTIHYDQVFKNYFAFDDGTSEGGYGINGQGSRNAMVAYRFESFIQDTIRAVQIAFNDTYLNSNLRAFDLVFWNDNNGLPGDILYTADEQIVVKDEGINGFYTYMLPDPIMVDDVFYVGWRQRTETFLNAGYDVNTPHNGRQFYWLNGEWYLSQVNGSIMIRPVMGKTIKPVGVDDTYPEEEHSFRLWPNPASAVINLESEELASSTSSFVTIIDLYGREILKVRFSERIDISSLKPGVYTVITSLNGRTAGYKRLIKAR
jgi:Secretion system C-terminal sorting domain